MHREYHMIKSPSPNFDDRTLPISMLVLHYTGMKNGKAALSRMCDASSKVSAHYMLEEDGKTFQLVDEKKRAWHAGISSWGGETNINSASIGIEIVNGGHDYGLPDFPKTQISAVIKLCQGISTRHNIDPMNIIAHSDIAPARKQDPGEKFPWEVLAKQGIGYWPEGIITKDKRILFEQNERGRGISVIQSGLAYIGYGVEITGVLDEPTRFVMTALQRRYRPDLIDGNIDLQSLEIVTNLANAKKSGSAADTA